MIELYNNIRDRVSALSDVPPLLFRLILSYGFYGPATTKINNFGNIVQWFGEGLGLPFPWLNALLATSAETAGFILLFLGLGTRIISVPLIITMLVAIFTVHIGNGFDAGDNGFEIPLYYILMLFSLIVTGPGKISLEAFIASKTKKE